MNSLCVPVVNDPMMWYRDDERSSEVPMDWDEPLFSDLPPLPPLSSFLDDEQLTFAGDDVWLSSENIFEVSKELQQVTIKEEPGDIIPPDSVFGEVTFTPDPNIPPEFYQGEPIVVKIKKEEKIYFSQEEQATGVMADQGYVSDNLPSPNCAMGAKDYRFAGFSGVKNEEATANDRALVPYRAPVEEGAEMMIVKKRASRKQNLTATSGKGVSTIVFVVHPAAMEEQESGSSKAIMPPSPPKTRQRNEAKPPKKCEPRSNRQTIRKAVKETPLRARSGRKGQALYTMTWEESLKSNVQWERVLRAQNTKNYHERTRFRGTVGERLAMLCVKIPEVRAALGRQPELLNEVKTAFPMIAAQWNA